MTELLQSLALEPRALRARLEGVTVPGSSDLVPALDQVVGQARAQEAIAFGLKMTAEGYNIAVSGPGASGRNTIVKLLVDAAAAARPAVPDWVYLHNFADPRRPLAVALPAALGDDLQRALAQLAEACRSGLPRAFESDSYQSRAQQSLEPVNSARERALETLHESARARGFAINATPMGLIPVPIGRDGKPLTPEAFTSLPEDVRKALEEHGEAVQADVANTLRELRRLDADARRLVEAVDAEVMRFVVGPVLEELRETYGQYGLSDYLTAVEADIAKNLEVYKRFTESVLQQVPPHLAGQATEEREALLRRYTVNLFVSHGDDPAAAVPVVVENHPSYQNLFGRIDFENRMGTMVTDFTRLRAGSVQIANGGYLIIQAQDLLSEPLAWAKLKQSLKTKEARIEMPGAGLMPVPLVDLVPQGIPLGVKVVLIGEPVIFALLDTFDPDFPYLFKIRAEFEPDAVLDQHEVAAYARFVRRTCDSCHLRPFTGDGLETVLHYGSRLAGRQDRLSTRYGIISDLCEESAQFAADAGSEHVTAVHVQAAIDARRRRSELVPDRLRRMIAEGTLHIATSGEVVGQVNGLAVYATGSHAFGTPTRITCRVGLGRRGVVAIERETERSGAIHSKGVLVLGGYLTGTFGRDRPLAFNASLTFEQTYDEVEGDSASSAELYAILTSLAGVPIHQQIAVTGSVDQFGNIQPVGGVTEKVEGFFDVCGQVGLTGSQGVIIPAANRMNLTLRPDVVEAVAAGRFTIWAVSRVEEGLELLTGLPAGALDWSGSYPPASIFGRVTGALDAMRELASSIESNNSHARSSEPAPRMAANRVPGRNPAKNVAR